MCGTTNVVKLLAAPRLNLSGAKEPRGSPVGSSAESPPAALAASTDMDPPVAQWLHAVREVMARTDDVGNRFAEEARKMHYGEAEERAIRGRATRAEAEALVEEGIEVIPLPLPSILKKDLQ